MTEDYEYHQEIREITDILKEMRKLRNDFTIKGRKKIVECAEKIEKKTRELGDDGFLEGERMRSISSVQVFWMALVMIVLLFFIGVSMGIGYMAIADLEQCLYKGYCIETPIKRSE